MSGVMEGVKVIELGAWVAGPGAGAVLGDWGAEVIKIEDPLTGDPVRGWRSISGIQVTDVHFWFEVYNRNKKSIGLDLRKEEGREILYKLVAKADVFFTNFQYSVLEKLKIDYDTLSALNPKLIYGVVSGYGKEGPDVEKPGYDITAFWSRSGILNKLIPPGGSPWMPPHAMGDSSVAMFLAGAISAALFHRERTGMGQQIDLSLFQSAMWVAAMDVQTVMYKGMAMPQINRAVNPNPLENTYFTKDKKWLIITMIQSDRFWPAFCKALKIEHLEKDEKFKDMYVRAEHNDELISTLDDIFATKTRSEWENIFNEHDLICSPINSFTDLPDDVQAMENNFFTEVDHPVGRKVKLVATPVQFQKTPASIKTTAPEVGQHTEKILLELGYTWEDISSFKEKKAIN